MAAQVSNIVKSANFHLVNIGRARRLLTDDATKLAIHTLVTSRLDYCNSLLIALVCVSKGNFRIFSELLLD